MPGLKPLKMVQKKVDCVGGHKKIVMETKLVGVPTAKKGDIRVLWANRVCRGPEKKLQNNSKRKGESNPLGLGRRVVGNSGQKGLYSTRKKKKNKRKDGEGKARSRVTIPPVKTKRHITGGKLVT